MNRRIFAFLPHVLFVIGIFLPAGIYARPSVGDLRIPDAGYVQILTATDGSVNTGRIVGVGKDEVSFETDLGVISISLSKIESIR